MIETVRVELGPRSYDIAIGPGLIDSAGERIAPVLGLKRVAVVTDTNVAALYLDRLEASLARAGIRSDALVVPAGEASKSFAQLDELLDRLLGLGIERGVTVIALGGGVVGDLAGFAAAIALRGLDFIQIPTTLLAQVDSAVGGKTGINARHGKNLVGAFHQPRLVLADIGALDTLERRQLLAGYAEVVKYGALGDAAFFDWLEQAGPAVVAGDPAARTRAVTVSCAAKAAIVGADEREAGQRALLNLGHTFGHALEAATGFGETLLHGEAVAVGMVLAFELSARLGLCPPEDGVRLARHLDAVGLPTRLAQVPGLDEDAASLLARMGKDKKVRNGRLTLVLARGLGRAFVAHDIDPAAVGELLHTRMAA